jgi:hypothetical protein
MKRRDLLAALLVTLTSGAALAQPQKPAPRYAPISEEVMQYNRCVVEVVRGSAQQTEAERNKAIDHCMWRNGWRKVSP